MVDGLDIEVLPLPYHMQPPDAAALRWPFVGVAGPLTRRQ